MENQENFSYIADMLKQINQSITVLTQNQSLMFEQYKSLDKKIDNKVDALEKKFDGKLDALEKKVNNKFDALEKKVDNNSANIVKILNTITKMQKDIVDLREDIDTVYDLERASREQIQ